MGRTVPYAYAKVTVGSTDWRQALRLERAWNITSPAIRFTAENVNWRVMLTGPAGPEELASGTVPSGSAALVRVGTLPATLAGAVLSVEFALPKIISSAQPVAVEMSWIPADSEQGPAENR